MEPRGAILLHEAIDLDKIIEQNCTSWSWSPHSSISIVVISSLVLTLMRRCWRFVNLALPVTVGIMKMPRKSPQLFIEMVFVIIPPMTTTTVMVLDLDAAQWLVIPYSVTNLVKRPENKYQNGDNVIEILYNGRVWWRWVADSVRYDPSQLAWLAWVTLNVMPTEIT